MDPWMDAAHRGTAPPRQPVQCRSAAQTSAASEIAAPQPGINKRGFIDTSDGANIRTGPAELSGRALTAQPLPPATEVFVTGTHPATSEWWYVTALTQGTLVRGYTQHFRVNTSPPEPGAQLYQIESGDTVEDLAHRVFSAAVRPGRDLRFYENVLLAVNRAQGRAGITGSFQDPGLLGGGSDNIQLIAGRRIWLVSPAYAQTLAALVPDGSFTGGAVAKAGEIVSHVEDILTSVTDSPQFLAEVGGEYLDFIKAHLPEILGVTAAFIAAQATSALLAATPTGVGQLVALLIQLCLSLLMAGAAVQATEQAMQHGNQWLTLAWTAHGDEAQLAEASKSFIRMLVSIAMAALAVLGLRGTTGSAAKLAESIKFQPPTMAPAMAVAGGPASAAGWTMTPGSLTATGPVTIPPNMMAATAAGGGELTPKADSAQGSRVPTDRGGTWRGKRGEGIFTPHGTTWKIRFEKGRPNFRDFVKPEHVFDDVKDLTGKGDRSAMLNKVIESLGKKHGFSTQAEARQWLNRQKTSYGTGLELHHSGPNSFELVPREVHRAVQHGGFPGSAAQLRNAGTP